MKTNLGYVLLGMALAVSGSLIAASTNLPYQFSAGERAKAAEVNSNFNTLVSAVNVLDGQVTSIDSAVNVLEGRVTSLEKIIPTTPTRFTVTQNDLPVGSIVTVGGISYTIAQFEVPRFDTDEVYLLKFPSSGDFTSGDASAGVQLAGAYAPDSVVSTATQITSLDGFDTLVSEGFSFQSQLQVSNSGRSVNSTFSQSLFASILLGPQTRVSLFLSAPPASLQGSNPTRSADASGIITVYPPTRTSPQRDAERQNLRTRLSYVTIKKKI